MRLATEDQPILDPGPAAGSGRLSTLNVSFSEPNGSGHAWADADVGPTNSFVIRVGQIPAAATSAGRLLTSWE
jgi:hypothetical protein